MRFKADRLRLTRIEVKSQAGQLVVGCGFQFIDPDGIVHGTIAHEIQELPQTVQVHVVALMQALTEWGNQAHFDTTGSEPTSGPTGIAESLREEVDPFVSPEGQD